MSVNKAKGSVKTSQGSATITNMIFRQMLPGSFAAHSMKPKAINLTTFMASDFVLACSASNASIASYVLTSLLNCLPGHL